MLTQICNRGAYSAQFTCREEANDRYVAIAAFEEDEYGVTAMGLGPGDAAIDLGAHIGAVSLLLAAMGVHVYAYEAVEENYRLLLENVARNGAMGLVSPHLRAVCGTNDVVTVHLGPAADKSHRYMGNLYSSGPDTEEVQGVTLDAVFAQNGIERCAVVKMDAEGAEWDILAVASKETLRRIDHLCGEYHTVAGSGGRDRAALLAMTWGLFEDVTRRPDPGGTGPFHFVRRGRA